MLKWKNFFVFIIFFGVIGITACSSKEVEGKETQETAWSKIEEKGKLIVATAGTLYPESFHSSETDKLTGYGVEVIREVAKRLELEVEFKEMAFDGMLTSINSGQVDVAVNDITQTKEREEKFTFSIPYKYSYGTALVRKSDLSGIQTLEDLKGKKAAGEATTTYMETARQYGAEEVIYDNATNDQYLQDVSNGRTDVILNDYYLQKLAIAAYPDLDITIHPNIKYSPKASAIVMKKENAELEAKINSILQEMIDDGTMSQLSQQFFDGADVTKEVHID